MVKFNRYMCVSTLVIAMGLINGCKDDDVKCQNPANSKCENYDPCYGKKPVSADFEIYQAIPANLPDYIKQHSVDIAFERANVGFRPIDPSPKAKYTWYLGTEVITQQGFVRDFTNTNQTGENNIPVTLIIEKEPDRDCFPEDDGRDTVTKYIQFVDNPCEYLTCGDFKVLFKGYKDSVIVRVKRWTMPSPKYITDTCLYSSQRVFIGFDPEKGSDTTDGGYPYQFNSTIVFYNNTTRGGFIGNMYNGNFVIDPTTLKVRAKYQILDSAYSFRGFEFSGRKIK